MTLSAATIGNNYPRSSSPTPSIASTSTSSSSSSGFSVASSSSVATSVTSLVSDTFSAPPTAVLPPLSDTFRSANGTKVKDGSRQPPPPLKIPHPQEALPAEQRQNPRRTKCSTSEPAPPVPSLQRQADRKVNFVENLVDSAAAIVETIWTPPKYLVNADPAAAGNILPLRVFIQETLRRSRTSYSTLQVALYYLIVIRPHIPSPESSIEQMDREEAQLVRAMQCGRRMFLAALILASKYLQDRNYSARAWSKISGLQTHEININEMAFLKAVDWKLHISEIVFQRWTDLVLKYTSAPSPSPVSPARTSPWPDEEERKRQWCELVKKLSPDLSEAEPLVESTMLDCVPDPNAVLPYDPPTSVPSPAPTPAPVPPPKIPIVPAGIVRSQTPTLLSPSTLPPRTLEPRVQNTNAFKALHPTTVPSQIAMPQRPSSQLPSPAVRKLSKDLDGAPRAMGSAMAAVQQKAMSGCVLENWPAKARRSSETTPGLMVTTPSAICRRSSLSTCMLNDDTPVARPSYTSSLSYGSVPASTSERETKFLLQYAPKFTSSPKPMSPYHADTISYRSRDSLRPEQATPCASPNSREAALSLHLLKESSSCHSSASTTPTSSHSSGSRKRSCPSTSSANSTAGTGTTFMTPMLRNVRAFGSQSPVQASCGSPKWSVSEKRRRYAEPWMESFNPGIPQNVR